MNELVEKINKIQVGESLTIGSGAVDVCITGIGVSAKHARIERKAMGFFIRDLASSSGTFVNRTKLSGSQRLKTGDVIKIGQTEWTFAATDFIPQPETPAPSKKTSWLGFFWRLVFGKK